MMIVRNETAVLPRLAASLEGQIDRWTIVDTGSIDETPAVARAVFSYAPGEVIQDKWRGYGPSRNVALKAAEPLSDWLLFIDADETFHGFLDAKDLEADADVIEAEQHYGPLRFWLPRLVKSGQGWEWRGRAHEYLSRPGGHGRRLRTDSFWIEHHADGGNRTTKFEREIELLTEDWADNPGDPRTAFYLGRSYDEAGRSPEAVTWYRRRISLEGWDEERFYSRWRLGVCLLRTGAAAEGCGLLWHSWAERPERAEPLVTLAEFYRASELWPLAWLAADLAFRHCGAQPADGAGARAYPDGLFVDSTATEGRAAFEASISAWYVGQHDRGRQLTEHLLTRDDLPELVRAAVETNRSFYA